MTTSEELKTVLDDMNKAKWKPKKEWNGKSDLNSP